MTIKFRLRIWQRMKGHLISENIIIISFLGQGWKRVRKRDQMIHLFLIIELRIQDKKIAGKLICKDSLIHTKKGEHQIFYSFGFINLDYLSIILFLYPN